MTIIATIPKLREWKGTLLGILMFNTACSNSKMNIAEFIIRLRYLNEFCYIMVYGENSLQCCCVFCCVVLLSCNFKHIDIDIHHCGLLQDVYYSRWNAISLKSYTDKLGYCIILDG